ncbi:helix-turn-helix domain-containing protein [Maribacter luteus]|uniref:helix-turn-helix domain-containing protein n=1 Tax=Maribacter luteus TaxID=2594478 RepID=UPI00248F9645|nr:response regulator transcription factor [Maribacter luteus]
MKITELKTNSIEETFKQLQSDFGGELKSLPKEYNLSLDNDLVQGEITGIEVNETISFLEYDITFNQDTTILNHTPNTNPIYFLYCAQGQMQHSFGLKGTKRDLNQFQTGIFACDPSRDTALFFKKEQRIRFSYISVDTHENGRLDHNINLLQKQLLETFMPKDGKEIFAYVGSYNLKIAEKMEELQAIKQRGIVRRLLVKGIVHLMLALEVQQHKEDVRSLSNETGSLSKNEMEMVKELSDFIQNYPERKYSMKGLSKKAGMSPAKLQEGFKLLHNRTVSDYIRNVRIETAENLIRTTDLNISEIVYTIGLTSRSYFSKIFKEKYNCSPKYYQDNQNEIALSA